MKRPVTAFRLERASAWNELSFVGGCLARAEPALLVTTLAGEAHAAGRHQLRNAQHGVRRWSGGRSTVYGEGIVSLCAVLPRAEDWLDEPGPLSGARLLNRYVRGVLAGLATLAKPATYPGRDFLCVAKRRVAYVTLARETNGAFLFQAVVGATRPFTTKEPEPSFAGLPDAPPAVALQVEPARVANALLEGFAAQFDLELRDATPPEPVAPATLVLPARLTAGEEIATPIGTLRAYVSLDASGALEEVRFTGDWIVSDADVKTLERALRGRAPEAAETAELCASWLAVPAHVVVGVPDPGLIVAALRSAAAR